ncbi:MAG: ABC transporter permease, partial [Acidimicrobiales bacterium]
MTMLKLALRGVRASLGRLALTAAAITLGVAFVTGSFVLADSVTQVFNTLFTDVVSGTDATIAAEEPEFGSDVRTLPDSLTDEVAALPEVGLAIPSVGYDETGASNAFALRGPDGNRIVPNGPPVITFSWVEGEAGGLEIIDGAIPTGPDEVAIDSESAKIAGVGVGDEVTVSTPDGDRDFTVATIAELPVSAGTYMILFDFPTAQALYHKEGLVDTIALTRASGVETADMIAAVEAVVPDHTEVLNEQQTVERSTAQFEQIISIFRNGLLVFAGIALFVSLFIINNTFAILMNQRLRQIGMLRAVGATRAQIRRSAMLEALVVGTVSAVLGLAVGIGLALLLLALLGSTGLFESVSLVIKARSVIVAIVVGVGATLVAALMPVLAAGRITPMAAMTNVGPSARSRTRRITVGALVLAAGLALLAAGLFLSGQGTSAVLTELGFGAPLTFVGVAMLSGLFAGPVVNLIGRPMVLGLGLLGMGLALIAFMALDDSPSGLGVLSFALKAVVSVVAVVTGGFIVTKTMSGGRTSGPGSSAAGLE